MDDEKKTFREFFKTYNKMSEICFSQCVWDFGVSSMRSREEKCINRCASQYLSAVNEIGKVFAQDQANLIVNSSSSE